MGFFSGIGDFVKDIASPVKDVLGGAGAILGPILGANSASAANAQNAKIAQAQMDFQERMRDTSYQAAVKDLKKAGLNPMLAYSQGGAAVPSGASYEAKPTITPESISTAFGAAAQIAQIGQIKAQTANINADTVTKLEEGKNASEFFGGRAREQTARGHKTATEVERMIRERDKGGWDAWIDKIKADVAQSTASAENIRSANMAAKMFMNSDIPGAKQLGAALQLIFK